MLSVLMFSLISSNSFLLLHVVSNARRDMGDIASCVTLPLCMTEREFGQSLSFNASLACITMRVWSFLLLSKAKTYPLTGIA